MAQRLASTVDLALLDPSPRLNVLNFAPGISISDGSVHTVGTAAAGTVFNGVTTLAGLAAITINGIHPFAFLTNNTTYANGVNYKTIFTGAGGYYALTDANVADIDIAWLAIQAAFLQGPWRIPFGKYIIGSVLNLTLMLPDTGEGPGGSLGAAGIVISGRGDGPQATILQAGKDFGAGKYLLCCGDPGGTLANSNGRYGAGYNSQGMYLGDISDLQLASSNTTWVPTATNIGTKPVNMGGFAWGARLRTVNVTASNFGVGWNFVGDHTLHVSPRAFGCYFGFYWDVPSANLFGAIQFESLVAGTCFAGMAANNAAFIAGDFQGETYLGGCTYAFLGETGGSQQILAYAEFQNLFCEYNGLGLFQDDGVFSAGSYTDANKTRGLSSVTFHKLDWSFASTYAYTSTGRYRRAWADVNQMDAVRVLNYMPATSLEAPTTQGSTAPVAFINCLEWGNNYYGCHWVGAMSSLFAGLGSLPFWRITGSFPISSGATWEEPGRFGGRFYLASAQGNYTTTALGHIFESGQFGAAQPGGFNYTANAPVFGVCYQAGVNISSGIVGIPLADHGVYVLALTGQLQASLTWGAYQKCTGIGNVLTITAPGSGGTNGAFTWTTTGGGGSGATGQFTVAGGLVTSTTITNQGSGYTSAPTIVTTASAGLTGATLTPKWPSAMAVSGGSASFGNTLGVAMGGVGSAPNILVYLKLLGLE